MPTERVPSAQSQTPAPAPPAHRNAVEPAGPRSRLDHAGLLALQRGAGNQAVSRMLAAGSPVLQRAVIGYVKGQPGPYDDTQFEKVTVEREEPGLDLGVPWLVVKEVKTNHLYLYEPPLAGAAEHYARTDGSPTDIARLRAIAGQEAVDDASVRKSLDTGLWVKAIVPPGERAKASKDLRQTLVALLAEGPTLAGRAVGPAWKPPNDTVGQRIQRTFPILQKHLDAGRLEVTPEIVQQINRKVLDPLRAGRTGGKTPDNVSESLAELDHAADVLEVTALAEPLMQGGKGREKSPGQAEAIGPESAHGALPPLHVMNLEVDAYYRTADGVLHIDEVKNTPPAFTKKLRDAGQMGRQIEWLRMKVVDAKGEEIPKQVGYTIRSPLPKFDSILDSRTLDPLDTLAAEQSDQADEEFIEIAGEKFSPAKLRALMDAAVSWLDDNKALTQGKKASTVFEQYFGSLTLTRQTLAASAQKPQATSTEKVNQ